MSDRAHLPTGFFADDAYTIAPERPNNQTAADDGRFLPHETEGQLSIDVFENERAVVIMAPIAGVKPENLEIYLSHDLVTIQGKREMPNADACDRYLFKECYWGKFSRSIILPAEIQSDEAEATLKNGLLTIRLPKQPQSIYIPILEIPDDSL